MARAWVPGPNPDLDAAILSVGAAEIARFFGVTVQAVFAWHYRGAVTAKRAGLFWQYVAARNPA